MRTILQAVEVIRAVHEAEPELEKLGSTKFMKYIKGIHPKLLNGFKPKYIRRALKYPPAAPGAPSAGACACRWPAAA